jgi:NAD(P)-dependent dehydrogenase (short-subunit alcohol dehydrogenase family)
VRETRDARVPLRGKMGTGWDTAYAALYLASDEAAFATGVVMPLDGGLSTRIG